MATTADGATSNRVEYERQLLAEAQAAGGAKKVRTYFKLSGPGWIASAITLGGGSLASSLYLGVLGGYSLMWVQPLAMIMGIIMLSTIGYVTLSSGQRPFRAINEHVSPVLGWSWALAVAAANVIWCMPQHSLAYGVLSQNLLPDFLGSNGRLAQWAATSLADWPWLAANFDKLAVSGTLLVLCTIITWSYDRGSWGLRLYEAVLKIIVAIIVLCFLGVVITLTFSDDPLPWGAVFAGLVPDFRQFFRPAPTFLPILESIGEVGTAARDFWQQRIVSEQRDVLISAAATAVGINMTLMFPYTMLRKGWTKEFRGLAMFDLWTGMFIPFVLATSCVVIASAARFHTELPVGFSETEQSGVTTLVVDEANPKFAAFNATLAARDQAVAATLPATNGAPADAPAASDAERRLAAMLVRRDAIDLSASLAPMTGAVVANIVFGLGVVAMALSTITILMLISGFVFAEMMNFPPGGKVHKAGTLVAGIGGALWPVFWTGQSQFWLAIVVSVFGFMLLPVAYITFAFLMNSRSLLGAERPTGSRRLVWNLLIFAAASIASLAAAYMIWDRAGLWGAVVIALFVGLALMVYVNQVNERRQPHDSSV